MKIATQKIRRSTSEFQWSIINGRNGLRDELETARDRLEELLDDGDDRSAKALEEQLQSVTNQMEAFVNQTQGWGTKHLTARTQALLEHDARRVIELLEELPARTTQ